MTSQEFGELMQTEKVREKLISALQRDFPKDRDKAEDWSARAIVYGLRKSSQFNDKTGAMAYVMEAGKLLAIKDKTQDTARRKAAEGVYASSRGRWYDPTNQIIWKVDLEKAIKLTTGNRRMQQALWHLHFEKWTYDEVIGEMPKDKTDESWRGRIKRIDADLRRRLNAFGYGR